MKCFVCNKSKLAEDFKWKPLIKEKYLYLCNSNCYAYFVDIYKICDLEVTIDKMRERLRLYKEKGGK